MFEHMELIILIISIVIVMLVFYILKKFKHSNYNSNKSSQKISSGNNSGNFITGGDLNIIMNQSSEIKEKIKDNKLNQINDDKIKKNHFEKNILLYCERIMTEHSFIDMIDLKRKILIKDIYITLKLIKNNSNAVENDLERALQEQCLILVSNPGGGKTTLLRHIAYTSANNLINKKNYKIPFFIRLTEFSSRFNCDIYKWIENNSPKEAEILKTNVYDGKSLFLFDGLDESNHDKWDSIREEAKRLANMGNQIIITCRTATYMQDIMPSNFILYEIIGFNHQQQHMFIENFFKNQPNKRTKLLKELHNRNEIQDIISNPLLLSLLSVLYENDALNFPIKKIELYNKFTELLERRWNDKRTLGRKDKFDSLDKLDFLSEIAYEHFLKGKDIFYKEDLLKRIRNWQKQYRKFSNGSRQELVEELSIHNNFLVPQGRDSYCFIHLTFNEYFTAKYISLQDFEKIKELIHKHILDNRWREVFGFLTGLIENSEKYLIAIESESLKYKITQLLNLNRLLRWANYVTSNSHNYIKPSIKRSIAISHASAIDRYLNRETIRAFSKSAAIKDGDSAIALAKKIKQTQDIENALNSANIIEVDLEKAHFIAYPPHNACVYLKSKNKVIDISNFSDAERVFYRTVLLINRKFHCKASNAISDIDSLNIFPNFRFAPLIDHIKRLENEIENKNVNKELLEFIVNLWGYILELSPDIINLSDEEWTSLDDYLKIYDLLLYCKEFANEISYKIFSDIEFRILYPLDYSMLSTKDLIQLTDSFSENINILESIFCLDILLNRKDISNNDLITTHKKLKKILNLLFNQVLSNFNEGNISFALKNLDDIIEIHEISEKTKQSIFLLREQICLEIFYIAKDSFYLYKNISNAIELSNLLLIKPDRISSDLLTKANQLRDILIKGEKLC